MGLLNFPNAPTNPGSLMGATRQHLVELKTLQADAFRSAAQNQKTGQAARAFSGSDVSNVQDQTADLTQIAVANNTKTVTIGAVLATNPATAGFNFNYLQRYIAGADAADLLARGAANVAQDQGTDQSAYAELHDFDGVKSNSYNELDQTASVKQKFDVDLSATVTNTTIADEEGNAFNQSRFRTIEALMKDQAAQAIFTTGQRQGHEDAPETQIAVGNGASSENFLSQMATVEQTNNTIDLTGDFNLRRNEENVLAPRATDLLAQMENNTAVNSSAASQDQVMMQSAAGGVDEDGNVTENGGNAHNGGWTSADNTERTVVNNSVSIRI